METEYKKVTNFDIFNKIKDHMLKQGERSIDITGNSDCAYYGFTQTNYDLIQEELEKRYKGDLDEFLISNDFDTIIENIANELNIPGAYCAVGCLIEENFYQPYFEGNPVADTDDILEALYLSNPGWQIDENAKLMLSTCQNIHDTFNPEFWKECLDVASNCFDEDTSSGEVVLKWNNIKWLTNKPHGLHY